MLVSYLNENGWDIIDTQNIEPRDKQLLLHNDLNVSEQAKLFLEERYPDGLYMHQKEALKVLVDGQNVCMLTGTASGKSMVFYAKGIDMLAQNYDAKIIAIYPLKALGREQEAKWAEALQRAGMDDVVVGRIDGDIHVSMRKGVLKKSKVVIMTPDIIHTWLLSNIGDRDIINFLLKVSLIIVDEVHTYTGVFGSNAAYLFRRFRHLLAMAGRNLQFICASATMANPEDHLNNLFGVPFTLIGEDLDTSPKHEVEIVLLVPPRKEDFLSEVTKLIKEISAGPDRFIAFIDSRRQTELISSILARKHSGEEEADSPVKIDRNPLDTLNILPYRAGYEEIDQQIIQQRLSQGLLKGVISTSALELGLDIPHLGIAVLIGVPYSATSLFQRIGRIGRHGKGIVYIIHSGSFLDEVIFKNPARLLNRPLGESALYLNNPRIQYIHTLCLARSGGEHDQLCNVLGKEITENDFDSPITWPDGFISLCKSERIGEITPDLQAMKAEAGDDPNHTYPLRDVESQFRVQLKQGPVQEDKGSLSYSQLLREAYPGAVYYYATQAYRVHTVRLQSRLVYVRPEKRYTTSPKAIPTQVFPNLTSGNIYNARN
ncbi:MAG TPA: DEAD/DEAH box helicase, partial [Peptococcaceae bacterium]|nr:DEAD/DEAH box helicase [Peptococcaceae bacterium]